MERVFRNFLYLDEPLLDDYLSAIGGELFDESVVIEKQEVVREGKLDANLGPFGGSAGKSKVTGIESTKQVKRTAARKFQELYKYLESEGAISFYECMDDELWTNIRRESLLECVVSPRFSKIDEMLSVINQFGSLADIVETITGEDVIDDESYQAIKGLTALGQVQQGKGIACICNFSNSTKHKFIAYLNPSCLKVPKEQIVGDVTLFCKVQRVLGKNEKLELVEFFPGISNLIVNREQRRKMKSDMIAPPELRETVRSPAAIVVPVALYR